MYIQYIQGLFQSRLGTADYALVTSSLHYNDSLVTWTVIYIPSPNLSLLYFLCQASPCPMFCCTLESSCVVHITQHHYLRLFVFCLLHHELCIHSPILCQKFTTYFNLSAIITGKSMRIKCVIHCIAGWKGGISSQLWKYSTSIHRPWWWEAKR
jgi:hypothetical protein